MVDIEKHVQKSAKFIALPQATFWPISAGQLIDKNVRLFHTQKAHIIFGNCTRRHKRPVIFKRFNEKVALPR